MDRTSFRGLRPVLFLAGFLMVVVTLSYGRAILMPIALAGLLTFLLSPIVGRFERRLGRGLGVILVVALTFSLLGVFAWALAIQAASLGTEIPRYRDNLKRKIAEVRVASRGTVIEKVQTATKEVVEELQKEEKPAKPAEKPVPVVVKAPFSLWQLPALVEALGNVALVLVLVIFMLIERQELRDRLIRLIGYGRLTTTTRAMDEAGRRISHYLLMQTIINGTFGLGVALGALVIGLPYAFLWGFLAAVLRFIPYVGSWAAALLVSLFSLAVFEGWAQPLLVVGLFIVLELFSNLVMETYLYSQSAGVSQVALLVAVAFWTWLWGAVGLALATPLTVCLVVLAKYVPDLEFVTVLLSDEPPMPPAMSYYQRLLAADQGQAEEVAEQYARGHPRAAVYDEILVPALNHARRDRRHGRISEEDVRFVWQVTRQIVEDLGIPQAESTRADSASASPGEGDGVRLPRILGVPMHDEADEIALLMLRQLLVSPRRDLAIASSHTLASEAIALVEAQAPDLVVIAALPGGEPGPHPRYLVKRLRGRFPNLRLAVGRWGADERRPGAGEAVLDAGADGVGRTLAETAEQVQQLLQLSRADWPTSASISAPTRSTTPVR